MNRKERRTQAKAAKAAPDRHSTKLAAAFAEHQRGNLGDAERLLRQVLALDPSQPDAMRLLGEVLADRGQFEESLALLRRLVALQSGNALAQYSLGNACRLGGQFDAAIAAYQAALTLDPNFAGSHHGLGAAYRHSQREREALEHLRLATRFAPGWAIAWKDLGLTLAALGELAPAQTALERAVSLDPSLADAHRHLAALRQKPASAAELAILSARAADARTPIAERIDLHFTLGRLADKTKAFDAAFEHFATANRLLRDQLAQTGRRFDRQRLSGDIDRIIATWPRQNFSAFAGWGNPSHKPVFIVGMPRAGSSLFEHIAASHGSVFGAGECNAIGSVTQRLGWAPSASWTQPALAEAAAWYLGRLPASDAARVTDKMPDNIFQLGLIACLFPNARVIFCERDPRDLALSCYFQHFSEPHGFDTDLADIAFRIRALDRLKNHWLENLPLRCLTQSYEALLEAPEAESRKLIEFLGLDWDERCLTFHQTGRVVRTATWAQVRKPLYVSSAGQWKHYESHLGALLTALQ